MTITKEIRKESSIPLQARVSLLDLATLDSYWLMSGHEIRSMSQLVSWSCGLLVEVLRTNGALERDFESVKEANNYMRVRGLYQRSLIKRGQFSKLGKALKFEALRDEGVDPETHDPIEFKEVHNHPMHKQFEGEVVAEKGEYRDDIEEAFKRLEEEKGRERKESIEKEVENAKKSGLVSELEEGISEEEFYKRREEQDKERIRLENQPVDVSQVETVNVDVEGE